ncbi:MAG: MinD/ParA family protein [Spirochaetaceae bacterium]|nr:MinD/ParA family protein [Spirochaetaceae bacterium]
MARHDESTERHNGLFNDADLNDEEDWPEAPTPSWLSEIDDSYSDSADPVPSEAASREPVDIPDDEPAEDPFADTQTIPSFDLGPHTESVVVDLTSAVSPRTDPVAETTEPLPAYDPPPPQYYEPQSEVATPTFPEPDPGLSRHAGARVPTPVPVTRPEPQPDWDIPPVPDGLDQTGAESLTAASVLRTRREKPQSGWRKRVLRATGGRINLGPSRADRHHADMLARARTPVRGSHRVAVISLKGGVGKTTTTAALGSMFADLRGDRVIAVDANPDRGTLSERVTRESGATIRHLLEARDRVTRYGDVRAFTSQSSTRLEVLASDSDPGASLALSEQDYIDTLDTLERFYNLVLTDCGTGLLHDAMRGVLGLASSLVVVSSASLDGARSASATLDWLEAHGLEELARNAVVVISSVRPGGGIVDVLQLEDHFASRCREVVTIPYDPHLEAGSALFLDELQKETLEAYLELAAAVGEGFALTPASR